MAASHQRRRAEGDDAHELKLRCLLAHLSADRYFLEREDCLNDSAQIPGLGAWPSLKIIRKK